MRKWREMGKSLESQRGAALLITMIVITVLGTIAFSIGASTISSFRRQSQLEDSLNAYQAAVSGLEDGLLRWRFNKDTETPIIRTSTGNPKQLGNFTCPEARPTTKSTLYDRVNLTTGEVTFCIDPGAVAPPDPTQIVYDIKIQYKKDPGEAEVVTSQTTPAGTVPALVQDEVVEYDISELPKVGANTVNIGWVFQNSSLFDQSQRVEAFTLDEKGEIIENSKRLFTIAENRRAKLSPLPYLTRGGVKVRIKSYGESLSEYKLEASNINIALDSRTTTVEVTGYFGQAKRKLKLALDRDSGSILPIYDNVLFSESSGITPQ